MNWYIYIFIKWNIILVCWYRKTENLSSECKPKEEEKNTNYKKLNKCYTKNIQVWSIFIKGIFAATCSSEKKI